MRYKITLALILAALFSVTALAETRSDYDRNYDFSKLRTWDFKAVSRMPNDPIARNEFWDSRIRDGLILHFALHPEQDKSKVGFLNLGPGRFFVETYFPNPNSFDLRFNPDAIRSGTLYGRPWISNEVTGGMVKLLPPKNSGTMPFPQATLSGLQ